MNRAAVHRCGRTVSRETVYPQGMPCGLVLGFMLAHGKIGASKEAPGGASAECLNATRAINTKGVACP